jgi:hypothetical protein
MVDQQEREHWVDVLQKLLDDNTAASIGEWKIPGTDESLATTLEELQLRLSMFVPLARDGIAESQAVDVNRHPIERAIVFLKTGCEYRPESWIVRWWFAIVVVTGIGCIAMASRWESPAFKWLAVGLLGPIVVITWLGSLFSHLAMGRQIVQVRLLKRNLVPAAVAADANDYWPFESAEAQLASHAADDDS